MAKPVRILIVDDDRNVRGALAMRLRLETGMTLVGEAGDGLTGVELALTLRPDVVLMDLNMPGMGGLAACRRIRAAGIQVVVFSLEETPLTRQLCREAGAAAFVSKQGAIAALLAALRAAAAAEEV